MGQRRDRQAVVARSTAVDMHNNFAKLAAVAVVLDADHPTSWKKVMSFQPSFGLTTIFFNGEFPGVRYQYSTRYLVLVTRYCSIISIGSGHRTYQLPCIWRFTVKSADSIGRRSYASPVLCTGTTKPGMSNMEHT